MDPVLQRLGDVTIQRLDKPKENNKVDGPQSNVNLLENDTSKIEDMNVIANKRILPNSPGPSFIKRTRIDMRRNLDDGSDHSFSDEETDYEVESEIESDIDISSIKRNLEESVNSDLEDNTDYLQGFSDEHATSDNPELMTNIKIENEDYDVDIKEKLKEMGEISFETVKKGEKPKKVEKAADNEVVVTTTKKNAEEDNNTERKGNMRRNIREVMDETKLDESTLAAQRQEMERLRRVQEQQRLIREVQRQMAQDRVISLLQGNNVSKAGTSRIGNTVLVKLPNGQTKQMTKLHKRPFDLVRVPKNSVPTPKSPRSLIAVKKPTANLTPSVSIAPVGKKTMQLSMSTSETESEGEDFPMTSIPKPKPKEQPITTIDISSDDDCIVVSESENDLETEDTIEDPGNSGLHTNDEFNQLDEQGRVVVNIGHPEDDADIYVAPQIAKIIKPHQIGGVRFLFDNVIESVSRFETSSGFGCILAHSMGLGKTLQVVCFSDIFLRHTCAKTILCIMPINTLQNWVAEYNMWLPTEDAAANSPLKVHGEVRPRNFNLLVLNDSHKTLAARAKVIHEWKTGGGVLLIGYEQYRLLSLKKHPKSRRKPNPAVEAPPEDDKNKALFDDVHEALVKPGPDLVICDEGHRIKNSHASISQALKQMITKRRIVLTGYPLQNNLMEYWCMVDFVRPNYLGTKTEFCNMFERPIQNGQCIDSTQSDIKLMRYRAHVLHSLLLGFVQRRSHTVLQTALPLKEEYVLLVRMTSFQRTLYETFMNEVVRTQTVPNPLKAFAVCCKIWNHPDVLYYFLKKRAGGEAVDIDLEEVSNSTTTSSEIGGKKKGARRNTNKKNNGKPAASVTPYNSTGEANNMQNKIKTEPGITNASPAINFENSDQHSLATNFPPQNSGQSFNNGSNNSNPQYLTNNQSQVNPQNYQFASNNFSPQNNFQNNPNCTTTIKVEPNQNIHQSQLPPPIHNIPPNQMMPSNQNIPLNQNVQQNINISLNSNMNLQQNSNQMTSNLPINSNVQPNMNMQINQNMPVNSNIQMSNMSMNSSMTINASMQVNSNMPMSTNIPVNANNMSVASSIPINKNMSGNPNMPVTSNSPHMSTNTNTQCNSNMSGNSNIPSNPHIPGNSNMSTNTNMSVISPMSANSNMSINSNIVTSSPISANTNIQLNPNMAVTTTIPINSNISPNPNIQTGSLQANNSTVMPYSTNTIGHNVVNYSQPLQQYNQNKPVGNYPQNQSNQVNFNQSKSPMNNYQTNTPPVQITYQNNFNNNYQSQQQQQQPSFQQNMQQNQPNTFPPTNSTNYNNFPNYQQNYWQDPNFKQNDYYNYGPGYNNGNMFGNPENPDSWIKKEDVKPNIFQSPIKTESYNETKPKINILSDIKLNNAFENPLMKGDKKIKILSDIKFEVKKEEVEEIKPEIKFENTEPKADSKVEIIDDDIKTVSETTPTGKANSKEDTGIPYDWAIELLKDYIPGCIENSGKMQILFCIIKESIAIGDRLLVFSQSLITLDLIEQFLQMNVVPGETLNWAKNLHYYRLDGSTSALEREKLINEFNSNSKIYLFLVSTRAGSLGINLIGANRVVVLDASWNPCHDTQAVCRVYRYGQRKPCFVYRLVVDNCMEKKIYDRQINKQGMSDRVVDECNPDAHLTIKDVSTLCWDDGKDEGDEKDWSHLTENYSDPVLKQVLTHHSKHLNKEPFQHESLLVDRKDKQLSKQEKRLAKKGYEREKQAARQPSYGLINSVRGHHRPVASVRPMQQGIERPSRWIPAEHWQRQGMTAQEMTLPLDVVIPTNQPEKGNIVLKAGQKVLVLKSPKGVYMQLENGKIVAIKTAIKVRGKAEEDVSKMINKQPALPPAIKNNAALSVVSQKRPTKAFTPGASKLNVRSVKQPVPNLVSRIQGVSKKSTMAKSKTYQMGSEMGRGMKQGSIETDTHQISSSDEEHRNMDMTDSMDSTTSFHEPHRRSSNVDSESEMPTQGYRFAPPDAKNINSPLQQLEQSSSSIIADKHQYQEKLETITNSYQDADNSGESHITNSLQSNRPPITISDHETDEEPSYTQAPVDTHPKQQQQPQPQQQQQVPVPPETIKSDIPPPDYGYGSYYNYNPMQPYPAPPPPPNSQTYPNYPQQPPPYEVMAYSQQPQYNYGVYPPQGYPPQPQYPPPPPPPQAPYDYNTAPPPPQPMYGGYPPQPYTNQQYPMPPQAMYPPIPAPQNPPYEYQYPQNAPPPPVSTPYYPNQ